MFLALTHLYLCAVLHIILLKPCHGEPVLPPMLVVYSPGEPEYTDVLVRREHDNLTLVCELRGDHSPRSYVWNYVGGNGTLITGERMFTVDPAGPAPISRLLRTNLKLSDTGHYMCSAPPFSTTKYILVQAKGVVPCARGALSCGARCVLAAYLCDGRADCSRGEDERLCVRRACGPDKLNCSSGRCIPPAACCRGDSPLCQQPACCDEFRPFGSGSVGPGSAGFAGSTAFEDEYPPLFEDRRAPDDYGFIQSTIYTVTACALIFMIAVVLLISAICKMQMKRAALRGYTAADRSTHQHYITHESHRFPPCYEASRLLEQEGPRSPSHARPAPDTQAAPASPGGLARLSAIFAARYRQVPTSLPDVELTSVSPLGSPRVPPLGSPRATPLGSPRAPPLEYRSPAYCDLNSEFMFHNPDTPELARELNYMATPVEVFRQRSMRRDTVDRVMDHIDRQRLTLHLGRFQVSLPRWGAGGGRAGTPPPPPATYTRAGRTILLGAPTYTTAVRYKLYGPPPEYLSREELNLTIDTVDRDAANNVEMPPQYEELCLNNGNNVISTANSSHDATYNDAINGNVTASNDIETVVTNNGNLLGGNNGNSTVVNNDNLPVVNNEQNPNMETLSSIIDNLPAIDSDVNANDGSDHVICDSVANNVANSVANNVANSVNIV